MVDELLQQSAANLLIGSQEDETAQADEGHPWYAACKQTAEKDRFKFLFLQKKHWRKSVISDQNDVRVWVFAQQEHNKFRNV